MNYEPGVILGDKYQILEPLGGGAMGKLYKAENISMHKFVAIKVMQGNFARNEEYQQRFIREARSAASLDHINICSMIDYDMTDDGDAYLVMELLSGETLADRIKRCGTLSPLSACLIMRQLMSALSCAHSKGIVHRDIKPDNVFLIRHEDRDDFVKLIDFGVAHIENPEALEVKPLTQSGMVYGTPHYLSPEQANGVAIDYRADLYAAGIIFYEMLVGKTPFDASTYLDLLIKQAREPAPHLPKTIANSQVLDEIVQRLLQKKPEDRYSSAAEVMSVLDNTIVMFTGDEPGTSSASLGAFSGSVSLSLRKSLISSQTASPSLMNHEGKLSNKKLYIFLTLGFIAVAGIISAVVVFSRDSQPAPAPEPVKSEPQIVYIEKPVEVPEIPNDNLTPEAYNTSDKYFRVSTDPVLAAESKLVFASEAYSHQEYESAFNAINEVKDAHWDYPNFLRLYLMSSASAGKKNEAFEAFAHLVALEPLASLNPAVNSIVSEYFDDETDAENLGNIIVQKQGLHSKTAISWLIIRSDYDGSEARLNRMIDVFDRLSNIRSEETGQIEETPLWMIRSVNIWRLGKKECSRRQTLLEQLSQMTTNQDEIYRNILIPLNNSQSKNCIRRRNAADCNSCLRPWLTETVNGYKNINPDVQIINYEDHKEGVNHKPGEDNKKNDINENDDKKLRNNNQKTTDKNAENKNNTNDNNNAMNPLMNSVL